VANKSKELTASVKLINDKLNFSGTVEGNTPISIDYISPLGDNLGYTSLELLLISFSTCLEGKVEHNLLHAYEMASEVKKKGAEK
jgi:hypothetical protein